MWLPRIIPSTPSPTQPPTHQAYLLPLRICKHYICVLLFELYSLKLQRCQLALIKQLTSKSGYIWWIFQIQCYNKNKKALMLLPGTQLLPSLCVHFTVIVYQEAGVWSSSWIKEKRTKTTSDTISTKISTSLLLLGGLKGSSAVVWVWGSLLDPHNKFSSQFHIIKVSICLKDADDWIASGLLGCVGKLTYCSTCIHCVCLWMYCRAWLLNFLCWLE